MRSFRKMALTLLGCLLIAGCASHDDDMDDINVINEPDLHATYKEMAREVSNGSVQIFSLDGPPEPSEPARADMPVAAARPVPPVSGNPSYGSSGVPSPVDPNVTVFPFDDDPAWPQPQAQRPPLVPPSQQYRPIESPFGGPLQSPAPRDRSSAIYFNHGSARLSDADQRIIDAVARQGGPVVVAGHASERADVNDPVERSIVNLKMSMDRAFRVSSQLIRDGVPPGAIETRAYGATRPAGHEDANRRVEIFTDGVPVVSAPAAVDDAPIPPLARY